jgi:hypothetical protein
MARHETLDDLRHHLYTQAQLLWEVSLVLSVATVALAIVGLASRDSLWVAVTGVAALLIPVLVAWIREIATTQQLRGDKCRRLILVADGLGRQISPAELAELRAWAVGSDLGAAPFTLPYFSSRQPAGPQRLADIAMESAFFTEHLARKLQFGLWIGFAILLCCALLVLHLADLAASQSSVGFSFAGKSIAVFIAFLISGDFALLAKKYGDLRLAAHDVYQRCAILRDDENATSDEVRNVVDDYGVAHIQCPPIPSWLYERHRDKLNAIYRESHGLN